MAERKKPQTDFVEDSSAADDTVLAEKELQKGHFNNVLRFVKSAPLESVRPVRTETYNALKRLQVSRDFSKAKSGIPKGSDQVDVGTLVKWLRSIEKPNEKAIEQLVILDAVCCGRFE